jgi:7-keto-8-aminopelargonate synthetase-like enzyme
VSATSSRAALGWTPLHESYERRIERFTGAPAACILHSTYLGGAVYYSVMAERCRTVVCDAIVHSNQYLGMRAAGLAIVSFRHLDTDDLRRTLEALPDKRGVIVATDAIYGISGELAPLDEIARLAAQYDAEFFVDDAHGFGVQGRIGRGTTERFGVTYAKTTVLCSMSKAMGADGGFLMGRPDVIVPCRSCAVVSGGAIPTAPVAAACMAALDLCDADGTLRGKLDANTGKLRAILDRAGIPVASRDTAIVALLMKDGKAASAMSRHLLARGFRVPYFTYASEPRENLLRVVGRSVYTPEQLERFEAAVRSGA